MTRNVALLTATCLTILFATTLKAQTQSPVWLRYTVDGEEFSVTLPAEPAMKTSEVLDTRLNKTRVERVLETTTGGVVYAVYAYENPKPRRSLDEFIVEQSANIGLDRTTERSVTVGKSKGKQYSSKTGNALATEQFFATEGHLYRFVVRGASTDHAGVRQFFRSISLGKKQEGVQVAEGAPYLDPNEKFYVGKDVDQKATITSKPDPQYTERARKHNVTGAVVLRAVLSASGRVTNIRVVEGLPDGLTEQAVTVARQIKFVPAMKDGKYVSTWVQLVYNFNLF
jgi:TonB family protein